MPDGFAILSSATAGSGSKIGYATGSFLRITCSRVCAGVADRNQDGIGDAWRSVYLYGRIVTVASTRLLRQWRSSIQRTLYDLKGRMISCSRDPSEHSARFADSPHSGSYWTKRASQAGPLVLEAHVLRPTTVKGCSGR